MQDLLPRVNSLLARVSIPRSFSSTEELADNASSFLVAVFEAVFKSNVSAVRRRPSSDQDYAHNAQRVITTFKELLPSRVTIPDTITGASVAAGELPSIVFLVSLLDDASRLLGGGGPVALSDAAKEALESLGHTVGEQAVAASEAEGVKGVASPPKKTREVETSNEALLASSLSFTTSTDGGAEISTTFASSSTTTTTTTSTTFVREEVVVVEEEKEKASPPITSSAPAASDFPLAQAPVPPPSTSTSSKSDIWAGTTPNKLKEKAAVRAALLGGSGGGGPSTAASSSSLSSKSAGLKSPIRPPPVPFHLLHQPPLQLSMTYNRPPPGTLTPLTAPVSPPSKPFFHGGSRRDAAPPPAPPGSDVLEEGGGLRQDDGEDGRSTTTSSTTAGANTKDGGASQIAAQIKALDERRAAAVVAMSVRRRMGVISRMAHANEEELKQIELMTKLTVKTREASTRVFEEKALKAASARASVARHERKVIALRARASIENITRNTLSMRIARSSKQQAASAAMLKALAAQARLGAADELKAAASERSTMLLGAQGRLAWLNHTARMMNEAVLEETAKQVEQRAVATRAQREALERALRDLEMDQGRLLEKMKEEQAHAEEAFLAQRVEPLNRASEALEGKATAVRIASDPTDTDSDYSRVRTLHRVQGKMGEGEVARAESSLLLGQAMKRGASEAGRGEAEAMALEQEAIKLGGRR